MSVNVFIEIFQEVAPIYYSVEFLAIAMGCAFNLLSKLLIKWIITYVSAVVLAMAACAFSSSWGWMVSLVVKSSFAY